MLESFKLQSSHRNSTTAAVAASPIIPVPSKQNDKSSGPSRLAGLSCQAHGGPPDEFAQEMVYWHDIPTDRYVVRRMETLEIELIV